MENSNSAHSALLDMATLVTIGSKGSDASSPHINERDVTFWDVMGSSPPLPFLQ